MQQAVQVLVVLLDSLAVSACRFAVCPEQCVQNRIGILSMEVWRMLRYIGAELSEVFFHMHHTPESVCVMLPPIVGGLQVGNTSNNDA